MSIRPQLFNPNYTLTQLNTGQSIMNPMGNLNTNSNSNNLQNYLQPISSSQLNGINIPNGLNNSYDFNYQNQNQINQPLNYNYQGYNMQPQYSDQNQNQNNFNPIPNPNPNLNNNHNQITQLPYDIPINTFINPINNNSLNNPNGFMGSILDNIGGDERKKKNNDEYKKLLLDQIERKKCKN
jgi:hypothetical protein